MVNHAKSDALKTQMARKKQGDLMAQAVALFHAKKMDWMCWIFVLAVITVLFCFSGYYHYTSAGIVVITAKTKIQQDEDEEDEEDVERSRSSDGGDGD